MKKSFAKVVSITAAGAMAVAAVPSAATAAHAARAPKAPAASQLVVTLHSSHTTYRSPGGSRQGSVSGKRPITGTERTTLPVLRKVSHNGSLWLDVRLPGRPNSHTGWIRATRGEAKRGLWHITEHIVISTGQRRAWVFNRGRVVKSWLVVVGAPGRPTPHGQFFVEENIFEGHGALGGPYALATSARSNVYHEFDGGPGQVALHGMDGGLYAKPGTAVSHGCVRLLDNEITWLAKRTYEGTPVTITN
jgi:lipoprotein-anchoring transpeptidase ErfK/SrfK